MSGRLIYEIVAHDFTHLEKAIQLNPGTYVVQLVADEKVISEKIVVAE